MLVEFQKLESYVHSLKERGIGEIILHSISRQGTREGIRVDMLGKLIKEEYRFPIIFAGGADSIDNILDQSKE